MLNNLTKLVQVTGTSNTNTSFNINIVCDNYYSTFLLLLLMGLEYLSHRAAAVKSKCVYVYIIPSI